MHAFHTLDEWTIEVRMAQNENIRARSVVTAANPFYWALKNKATIDFPNRSMCLRVLLHVCFVFAVFVYSLAASELRQSVEQLPQLVINRISLLSNGTFGYYRHYRLIIGMD